MLIGTAAAAAAAAVAVAAAVAAHDADASHLRPASTTPLDVRLTSRRWRATFSPHDIRF